MRLRLFILAALFAHCLLSGSVPQVHAQNEYFFQPTGPADYDEPTNWLYPNTGDQYVPSAEFNEFATIDNGGTAIVSNTPEAAPGALNIGSTRADVTGVGTLEVRDGGNLNIVPGTSTSGAILVGTAGTGVVRVLPGGTLTTTAAFGTGGDAADSVTVGDGVDTDDTATLTAGTMAFNGTTRIYPNAAVGTSGNGNVIFGNNSVYTAEVNSAGTANVNAGGLAILNGRAHLNFTGVTPTVGPTWTIVKADNFENTLFDQITTNATLPSNQVLVQVPVDVGGGRRELRVNLEQSIVLEVNRNDGMVTMTHPGTGGITLDSYYIGSASGALVPGNFNGLDAQNALGGNWIATDLRSNNIAELKPTVTATYNAGTNIPLGKIFDPFAGDFGGASEEDLQFVYSRFATGAQVPAIVKYTGTKVNNLVLQVDPTGAGDAYLRNTSETTVNLDIYHVLSQDGRLSPTNWNSLDDSNVDGAGTWLEATNNTANRIAEFNASFTTPYLTLEPGEKYNLGQLYLGGTRDLVFEFQMQGSPIMTRGAVIYEAFTGVNGDYNGDGVVNAADYTVWRNNLGGSGTALQNRNPMNGGVVNTADYTYWKNNYGNSGGAGSGGLAAGSVPEPESWMLVALAGVAIGFGKRRT